MSHESDPSSDHTPENQNDSRLTRRTFLKGAGILVGSMTLPEVLSAEPRTETETSAEGEPGPEYSRGMQELREKAATETNESFGVYREQEGVGGWMVTEKNERSGRINLEETKKFMGENPSHTTFVHTHPERQPGKGWSPPSLLDIHGVVMTNLFFEGQKVNIRHQAIDTTGVWNFNLDPTSRFAVAVRYLQTRMPDLAEALIEDARFQRFGKENLQNAAVEDPRTTGRTILHNTDKFGFSARRTLRKMGKLEETLLGDFHLEGFDFEVFNLSRLDKRSREERLEDLKRQYEKIGVTLNYEPFQEVTLSEDAPNQ